MKRETRRMTTERPWRLVPSTSEELPPPEVLLMLGPDNLLQLEQIIEQAKDVINLKYGPNVYYPDSSPLAAYNKKGGKLGILLKFYLEAIQEARIRSEKQLKAEEKSPAKMPFLPDLRPINWVEPGEKILLTMLKVNGGIHDLYSSEVEVDDVLRTDKSYIGPLVTQIRLRTGEQEEVTVHNLRSYLLLRYDELAVLKKQPAMAEFWIRNCGKLYPEWSVTEKIQELWRRWVEF